MPRWTMIRAPRATRRFICPAANPARNSSERVTTPCEALATRAITSSVFSSPALPASGRIDSLSRQASGPAPFIAGFSGARVTLRGVIEQLVEQIEGRFAELERLMSDPEVIADRERYAEVGREYRVLQPAHELATEWLKTRDDLEGARELLAEDGDDPELKKVLAEAPGRLEQLGEEIRLAMVERDPNDEKNVLVEIRAGTGGDEAALFAGDLYKMLTRYAERRGYSVEVLTQSPSEVGRNDLQIDVYRSSGPGGQSVNTTDSAVRITHKPTGVVVSMQDEKSQLQNREKAMRVLRARLLERKLAARQAEVAAARLAQVGTGERAEKVRTYNFPQDRVTDHRVGLTKGNLPGVLSGDLDEFTAALEAEEKRRMLEAAEPVGG